MPKVFLITFMGMTLDADSDILIKGLARRGIEGKSVAWDDPNIDWSKPFKDQCLSSLN